MAKKKINLYLSLEQIQQLRELSTRTGIPTAVIVRAGLQWAIEHYAKLAINAATV
jgi:predicted DNA-binding protein